MKIKKREFEKLVRDSEKLQHVKAIVLNEDTAFVNREELLRACGLTTEQEEVYISSLGETVFLTRAEAENKMKELEEGNGKEN